MLSDRFVFNRDSCSSELTNILFWIRAQFFTSIFVEWKLEALWAWNSAGYYFWIIIIIIKVNRKTKYTQDMTGFWRPQTQHVPPFLSFLGTAAAGDIFLPPFCLEGTGELLLHNNKCSGSRFSSISCMTGRVRMWKNPCWCPTLQSQESKAQMILLYSKIVQWKAVDLGTAQPRRSHFQEF